MKCIGCHEIEGATSLQFSIFKKVVEERIRQAKFAAINNNMTDAQMLAVLSEEHGEIAKDINDKTIQLHNNDEAFRKENFAVCDHGEDERWRRHDTHADIIIKNYRDKMKTEITQLAALCFQWLERIALQEAIEEASDTPEPPILTPESC